MESLEINSKILVTGSEGYIGSVLMPVLINNGYQVTGLDSCFYSEGNLTNTAFPNYNLVRKDLRNLSEDDLKGFDAVIHLAGLSNDPLGMLDENLTYEINYHASVNLAGKSKAAGVRRFIFSSSCSLYGANDKVLTEDDEANPQTAYGKSKILAENGIRELAGNGFSPVFLRNATAFGISPRMRFDLVVNSLSGYAKTENVIRILGDGTPWRPLVHVKDICQGIIRSLKAQESIIHNQAFNIGSSKENYQIKTIAGEIKKIYSECQIEIMTKKSSDTRNYMVSFDKVENMLGFRPEYTLLDGIKEIADAYEHCCLNGEIFNDRRYTRLKQIEWLLNQAKIDSNLYWINN